MRDDKRRGPRPGNPESRHPERVAREPRGGNDGARKPVDMLPHPEILEGYNYVVEGSARLILEMFEREQRHRHEWENRSLKVHLFSTILGQVLGFLVAVAIFVSAAIIGIYGDSTIGAFVWVFGMALVCMSALVWWYAKSLGQRPLFARPALRSSYRPQKQTDALE